VSLTRTSLRMGFTAALSMALVGCGATGTITQTAFQRQASDGASIFSAAGETLRFVHAQPAKMTVEYGTGSMINYEDQASSLPDELPTAEGAPDGATVDHLVSLVEPAVEVIENPCLLPDCDWQSQTIVLDQARDALLEASQ
jgi:hypothetical protein